MNLKFLILTITVGFLGVISVFFVLSDFQNRETAKVGQISEALVQREKNNWNQSAFILPVTESNYLPLRNWNILEPDISAKAFAVFDARSEKFLAQKNLKARLPVASITKLLAAIVIAEQVNPESEILITKDAMNVDNEGGEDFYLNEIFTAKDLFRAMLVKSSNDATAAFKIFMEEKGINLIDEMNKKAKHVGMLDSFFYDPAGLDDRGYSTAEDLIKLLDYSVRYPEIQSALTAKRVKIQSANGKFSHDIENTNKLLGIVPDIVAGKTGFTDGALGTMVLKINLSQHTSSLAAVVLGSDDRLGDIKKLIEWAKAAHKWE